MKVEHFFDGSVIVLEPKIHKDERGYFLETFNQSVFSDIIGYSVNFVQDNHSRSNKNVLRGLHLQAAPHSQGKLVRVSRGSVLDVVVDFRKKSSTFGHFIKVVLSEKNFKQLWIPEGFGHGFLSLEENTDFCYKVTEFYNREAEVTVAYNDPDVGITWPEENFIISQGDQAGIKCLDLLETLN